MKTHLTFAAGIAALALFTACTKERLEPMTAVPEVRATVATTSTPSTATAKHAQEDRIITQALVVDRGAGAVTSSHVHDIAFATPKEHSTGTAVSSHLHDITFLADDRVNGNSPGLVTTQADQPVGVCWYCWQTGLSAYPAELPARLLENDDPMEPAPPVHISGQFRPVHPQYSGVIARVRREVPENETSPTPSVTGPVAGVTISDDHDKDE